MSPTKNDFWGVTTDKFASKYFISKCHDFRKCYENVGRYILFVAP